MNGILKNLGAQKNKLLFLYILLTSLYTQAKTTNVLFLGNSYVGVNNLSSLTKSLALSAGDTINTDAYTPGGYTLKRHASDAISLQKIKLGTWDYVILQEQSQLPSFPPSQVETEVFPWAAFLDSIITVYNPCAKLVFYMTWGRKNGDASNCANWPPVCTYAGMDQLLHERYMQMANQNNGMVAPVGAVWRYLRKNQSQIELYDMDESHPSLAGSYAAACSFYAILTLNSPLKIKENAGLDSTTAALIRQGAEKIVFDSLQHWKAYNQNIKADFSFFTKNDTAFFQNLSKNGVTYYWDYGDGQRDSIGVKHVYNSPGKYIVTLYALGCGLKDSMQKEVVINGPSNIQKTASESRFTIYPNPTNRYIYLHGKAGIYRISNMEGRSIQCYMETGKAFDVQKHFGSGMVFITDLHGQFQIPLIILPTYE